MRQFLDLASQRKQTLMMRHSSMLSGLQTHTRSANGFDNADTES